MCTNAEILITTLAKLSPPQFDVKIKSIDCLPIDDDDDNDVRTSELQMHLAEETSSNKRKTIKIKPLHIAKFIWMCAEETEYERATVALAG